MRRSLVLDSGLGQGFWTGRGRVWNVETVPKSLAKTNRKKILTETSPRRQAMKALFAGELPSKAARDRHIAEWSHIPQPTCDVIVKKKSVQSTTTKPVMFPSDAEVTHSLTLTHSLTHLLTHSLRQNQ